MREDVAIAKLLGELPQDVAARLQEWLPRLSFIKAARAKLGRLRGKLRIDSVATGSCKGKRLSVEEVVVDLKADAVALEKSRVELHVDVELVFQVPSIRSREPRVFKLGPVHEHVATPSLPRIDLRSVAKEITARFVLSSIQAEEVTAEMAPIRGLDAGEAEIDGVELEEIALPARGLGLGGMQLGKVAVESVGIDGLAAKGANVGRVRLTSEAKATDILVRGVTLTGGKVVAAEGDDLNLSFEVQLPALTIKTFPSMPATIERLVTRLQVRMEPKVVFQIGNVRLEGLSLSTRVGNLRVGELSVPVEVTGAVLEAMEVDDVRLEGIRIEPVSESQPQGPEEDS